MTVGFLLLLALRWLIQPAYQLVFKATALSHEASSAIDTSDPTARLAYGSPGRNLPPAQSIPLDDQVMSQLKRGKVPVSVTEHTTELLDKE